MAGLAENLNIQVVECYFGQGYLFSKPMPAEDVPNFRIQGDFLHANPNGHVWRRPPEPLLTLNDWADIGPTPWWIQPMRSVVA